MFENDFRVLTPTAGVRWVHSKGRPQFASDGKVIGIHGAFIDTTRRKQIEERLTHVNDQLETFAYSVAHDLQEPLRTIALSVQLAQLRLKNRVDEQSNAFLDGAVESARQMETMVRDLLAYSRSLTEGEVERVRTDASAAFEQALKNLATRIAETGATVTASPLPAVRIPRIHMLQVFQNLIDNSLKHRGAESPLIQVAAACENGMCQFSIADNGLGIEPRYHERVFDVFKRLRKSDAPGTGVGLALCKRTVEHYGGTIWIESDGQTGTTFFFTIPSA
jgi:light-regulated signal transduction histidine kinase (bacteriophytochrome)